MICCRDFIRAMRSGSFFYTLDDKGDAVLKVRAHNTFPLALRYCPFCGTKLDLGYQVPQEPYVPGEDRHIPDVGKAWDFNRTVTCAPDPDVHLE